MRLIFLMVSVALIAIGLSACADYDRYAHLRYRHDQRTTLEQFGIYDCVPR